MAEEEDCERRPRGCQCGLWKRVSKFNLTECRGVQPPSPRTDPAIHPAASRYIQLHPARCIALYHRVTTYSLCLYPPKYYRSRPAVCPYRRSL